jgi:hypothetical protein
VSRAASTEEISTSAIRRSMWFSTFDGGCYALMWGLGEAQFAAFALFLYASESLAGLVTTIPMVAGTAISLISPWAVAKLGSHKRWIVMSSFAQVATFIPLIVAGLAGWIPKAGLFAAVTLYFAAAWCAGLTWNTFIAGMVHPRLRSRYFGRRVMATNLASVCATFLAGVILSAGQTNGLLPKMMSTGEAFALVFALAALARVGSGVVLQMQVEPNPMPPNHRHLSIGEFVQTLRGSSTGRLITYILAAQFAVQVSTPFVSPYLLAEAGLKSNYTLFGVMLAVQLVVKAVFMNVWGRFAHARGPHALLAVGAAIIVPQPVLWLLPPSVPVLLVLQVSSGIATAAFELGIFLMLLRHVDDGVRTSIMARYQLLVTLSMVVGSLIGAGVLELGGHNGVAYAWLFGLGTAVRALTLPMFFRIRAKAREDFAPAGEIAVELHPGYAAGDVPLAASAHEPGDEEREGRVDGARELVREREEDEGSAQRSPSV